MTLDVYQYRCIVKTTPPMPNPTPKPTHKHTTIIPFQRCNKDTINNRCYADKDNKTIGKCEYFALPDPSGKPGASTIRCIQ